MLVVPPWPCVKHCPGGSIPEWGRWEENRRGQIVSVSGQRLVEFLKHCLIFFWVLRLQPFEIHQLPPDRWKIANGRWGNQIPLRLELMKRPQKEVGRFVPAWSESPRLIALWLREVSPRRFRRSSSRQILSRKLAVFPSSGVAGVRAPADCGSGRRREMFGKEPCRSLHSPAGIAHRRGPEDADDQWRRRVSPHRDRQTNDLDFSEAKLFLYDWPDCSQLRGMDGASEYGSDLDLDLGVSLTNKDQGSVRVGAVGDDTVRDSFANLLGNTIQRGSYPHERCLSILNREINQIDVDREAG